MNEHRALIGYTLALVLISVIGFCFFLWPTYRRITALDTQIEALVDRVSLAQADADLLVEAHQELERLASVMDYDLKTVPTRGDLPGLRSAIGSFVSELDLGDHDFKRGRDSGPSDTWSGSSLALNVDTAGPFECVYGLLQRIESLPRLVRVRQVMLERQKDMEPGQVLASISVDAYYLPEEQQAGGTTTLSSAPAHEGAMQ
ncbi:MAG: hypothetical protein D8M59_11055 [Planctomycetes bacterium]|nr:hypothetical protein [Planctomycetota bacterium]NOG54111.1 type 4a pilus biogenesis protein PilO [Planctomycetota bacterium]